MQNINVLIIGGGGFIGKHIVNALQEDHVRTVIFDINIKTDLSTENCEFICGAIDNIELVENVIKKKRITHVIHLVSTTLPKSSNDNIEYDLSSNVIATIKLLDLCVKYSISKVLFMSSGGTIYGPPQSVPVIEDHATDPICSYGISKLTIEKYLRLYKHLYGLDFVVLRAANPYGPGQNPMTSQGVIANFIHKMHTNQPLEVWGDGSIVRDYFDVRDLAQLSKIALMSTVSGVFNAGSGRGVSIDELIDLLSIVGGITPKVVYKEQRLVDVPVIILNCEAAKVSFGWCANTPLQVGINDYIEWYRATHM